jgi:hypothetical protein
LPVPLDERHLQVQRAPTDRDRLPVLKQATLLRLQLATAETADGMMRARGGSVGQSWLRV